MDNPVAFQIQSKSPPVLGVDFDNTLVCYDDIFHASAVARGLMPIEGPRDKRGVRAWFCERDREKDYTLLQGYAYGPGLEHAQPYDGALDCLRYIKTMGFKICVVSHKTRVPHLGPPHDLRRAAYDWLKKQGFCPDIFSERDIFFEDTLDDKAARVVQKGCACFVDDMKRFLEHPLLPPELRRFWFHHPSGENASSFSTLLESISSWKELKEILGISFPSGIEYGD